MGFHATIAAGTDEFGNTRHKSAPRVRVTEKVTGSAQVRKFHELAGAVKEEGMEPTFSDTSMALAFMLAGRRITDCTATMATFRKESATRHVAKMRNLGYDVVVRKLSTKEFKGWQAMLVPFGQKNGPVIAEMPTGSSINTNGEREDCCRAALNRVYMVIRAMS